MRLFCQILTILTAACFWMNGAFADEQTTVTKVTESPTGEVTKTVETTTVRTPVPAAKEVVATPAGYVRCNTIAAGWYKGVWYPEHRVCEYSNSPEGVAWIEGYWACTQATNGECLAWDWRPGHWEKTLENY